MQIPNKEVAATLSEAILRTLKLKEYPSEDLELFLDEAVTFLEKSYEENKLINIKEDDDSVKIMIKYLIILFQEPIQAFMNSNKEFIKNATEKQYKNIINLYLCSLKMNKWSYSYQSEICVYKEIEKANVLEKINEMIPDFIFSKSDIEIHIEFLKTEFWSHIERNYHLNSKSHTKKIINIFLKYKNFEIDRMGIICLQKESSIFKKLCFINTCIKI